MYIKNSKEYKIIDFFDNDNLWIEGLSYKEAENLANEILNKIKGDSKRKI